MKKIILLIFIVTLTSCDSFFQLSFDQDLTDRINSEYLKEKKPIDLNKITDFEWDNYIIIGPYSIPEEIGKKYNIDLSNISKYAAADDSKLILVFIKNKKSIKICQIKYRVEFNENKLLKIE
ncbi:hypothetical protein [Flavobacterium limnosediminis]|uniref:hypothetical protein n=1 Tax=Flavobacterium limnosediminis TaxID=1401027 RepID=UPI00054CEBCF|nr:hypothetical protein [Flavobacterium limnosediminis]